MMCALYMNHITIEAPDLNMLIFIDEATKEKQISSCQYGQSMRGVCCCVRRCFVHGMRYSIVPAITLDGIIAYDIVEGPADGKCFLSFLKEHVVHQL